MGIDPSQPTLDHFCVCINAIARHDADVASIPVLGVNGDLRKFPVAQPTERMLGLVPEGLATRLWRINFRKPYAILSFARIKNRQRVAVSHTYDGAGDLRIAGRECVNGASNNPFHKKRQAYKESSIKLTQDLLKKSQFKFKEVEQRSKELAEIAIGLWPMP